MGEEEREMYNDQYDKARYLWIGLSIGMILWTVLLWVTDAMKYDNSLWARSEKIEGKKLSDLLCWKKKDEDRIGDGKEFDDDGVLDGKTLDFGDEESENEDELLKDDDVGNDAALG